MTKGDNYLITYNSMNKSILGTFTEEANGLYYFFNMTGAFAISQSKIDSKEITLELMEDY